MRTIQRLYVNKPNNSKRDIMQSSEHGGVNTLRARISAQVSTRLLQQYLV